MDGGCSGVTSAPFFFYSPWRATAAHETTEKDTVAFRRASIARLYGSAQVSKGGVVTVAVEDATPLALADNDTAGSHEPIAPVMKEAVGHGVALAPDTCKDE
eukprot:NODE_8088_length_1524_cov_5.481031.p5 GENE.NODE_8088_length_1524_cov_5.481031~~NODE_8088_length_1524_cov_5.481031.p5  ORF type:complete len:102 (-),score=16.13 NODE_8088_length_1524_cov_5.481031:1187-1492(-)